MLSRTALRALLVIVGVVAGAMVVQLLWPRVGEAQGPGQGGPPEWVIETRLPTIERQVATFRAVPPDTSDERVDEIVRGFGMQGKPDKRENILQLEQGDKSLWMDADTGAVSYQNTRLMGAEGQKSLPRAGPAGASADKFLRDNGLLPREAHRSGAEVIGVLRQTREGGPVSTEQNEIQVNYRFKLGGRDVVGPGAKGTVVIGDGGGVVGVLMSWRNVEKDKEARTRTANDALREMRKKGAWNLLRQAGGPVKKVHVRKAQVAYWAEDIGRSQEVIEPCFVLEGTLDRADGEKIPFMQAVSAVEGVAEPELPPSPPQPPREE